MLPARKKSVEPCMASKLKDRQIYKMIMRKPPFRFIGNKGNRKFQIFRALTESLASDNPPEVIVDLFGGSLYCTHLASRVKKYLNSDVKLIVNDFDSYSELFCDEMWDCLNEFDAFMIKHNLNKNDLIPKEFFPEINAIKSSHEHLRHGFKMYTSMFGDDKNFRNRVFVPKKVTLDDYIGDAVVVKKDYRILVDEILQSNIKRMLFISDPPYLSTRRKVRQYVSCECFDQNRIIESLTHSGRYVTILGFGYEYPEKKSDFDIELLDIYTTTLETVGKNHLDHDELFYRVTSNGD